MATDTIHAAIAGLDFEAEHLEEEVAHLDSQLSLKKQRLAWVREARQALRRLTAEPEVVQSEDNDPDKDDVDEGGEEADRASAPRALIDDLAGSGQKPGRTRIRSTQLVANLVRSKGRPMSREDIRDAFREQGLIPPTWKHPDNAIGNAIARAASQGAITALMDGSFVAHTSLSAPSDVDPMSSPKAAGDG